MILGLLGLALSTAALVACAALRAQSLEMAYVHAAVSALTAILIAVFAIRQCRAMLDAQASSSEVAASNARYMGLVWSWGALALIGTYASGVLVWKEWWHFAIAFVCAAGLSLWFSATLKKDADTGREDAALLRLARYIAIIQLVGMIAAVVGLIIDGKMRRFALPRYTDWAANNVFFFGAIAVALISGYALRNNKHA
jgi:hypothetical protein